LLICETCRQALVDTESYIPVMRSAAARLSEEPASQWSWWKFPRWAPALAALILAILAFSLFRPNSQAPVAVTLAATRGAGIEATVPAGRRLSLTPDLTRFFVPVGSRGRSGPPNLDRRIQSSAGSCGDTG